MSILSTKPRSLYLFYHNDGLTVTYKGNGLHTLDYGTARSSSLPYQFSLDPSNRHAATTVPTKGSKSTTNVTDGRPDTTSFSSGSTIHGSASLPYLRYFECKIVRKEKDTDTITIGLIPEYHHMDTAIGTYTNPYIVESLPPQLPWRNRTSTTSTTDNTNEGNDQRSSDTLPSTPLPFSLGYRSDGYKVGQTDIPSYNFISATSTGNTNTTSHPSLTTTNNINQLYHIPEIVYGSEYEQDDTIGCGYNSVTREIFFTKNGKIIPSTAFTVPASLSSWPRNTSTVTSSSLTIGTLYPAVSLHAPSEQVTCYFDNGYGMVPVNAPYSFRFNTREYYAGYLRNEKQKLLSTFVPSSSIVTMIIADYCLHYGYSNTLRSLYTTCLREMITEVTKTDPSEETVPSFPHAATSSMTQDTASTVAPVPADANGVLLWLRKDSYRTLIQAEMEHQESGTNAGNTNESLSFPPPTVSSSSSSPLLHGAREIHTSALASPLSTPLIAASLPLLSPSLTPLPSLQQYNKAWVSPLSLSSSSCLQDRTTLPSVAEATKVPEFSTESEPLYRTSSRSSGSNETTSASSVHTMNSSTVFSSFSSPYFRSTMNSRSSNVRSSPLLRTPTLPLPSSSAVENLPTLEEVGEDYERKAIVPVVPAKTGSLFETINAPSVGAPFVPTSSSSSTAPVEPVPSSTFVSSSTVVSSTVREPQPTDRMFPSLSSSWAATDPTFQDIQLASGIGTLTLPSSTALFRSSSLPTTATIGSSLSLPDTSMDTFFHQVTEQYRSHLSNNESCVRSNALPLFQMRSTTDNEIVYDITTLTEPSQPSRAKTPTSPMDQSSPITTERITHTVSSTVPLAGTNPPITGTGEASSSAATAANRNLSRSEGNLPSTSGSIVITIERNNQGGMTTLEGTLDRGSGAGVERNPPVPTAPSLRTTTASSTSSSSTAPSSSVSTESSDRIVHILTSDPLFTEELNQIMEFIPSLLQPREEDVEEEEIGEERAVAMEEGEAFETESTQRDEIHVPTVDPLLSGYVDIEMGESTGIEYESYLPPSGPIDIYDITATEPFFSGSEETMEEEAPLTGTDTVPLVPTRSVSTTLEEGMMIPETAKSVSSPTVPPSSSRFFTETVDEEETKLPSGGDDDTDTVDVLIHDPVLASSSIVNPTLIQAIQHNLEASIPRSALSSSSTMVYPSPADPTNVSSSVPSTVSTTPVTVPYPLPLSSTARIAASNALLLCYGYGMRYSSIRNEPSHRTVSPSSSSSSLLPLSTGLISPSCASYTTDSTTKRIRYRIPHTFQDLLSYTDVLHSNQRTLMHRSTIRTLLLRNEYDTAIEYLHAHAPSVLTYPPHAALIGLLLNCQRILLAIQANDISEAYQIVKDDISPYLDYHQDHENFATGQDNVSLPYANASSTTATIRTATSFAMHLHTTNLLLADAYSFRQCLSYVRSIVTLLGYSTIHTATVSSLSSLITVYQQNNGYVLADIINSAILEWEYAGIASIRFHKQCKLFERIYASQRKPPTNDKPEGSTSTASGTVESKNTDSTVGSKRPRQDTVEPSRLPSVGTNPSPRERTVVTSSSSSGGDDALDASSGDESYEHTLAYWNRQRSSQGASTTVEQSAPSSSIPEEPSSSSSASSSTSSSLSDLFGLGMIQRVLSSLSPQRVLESLGRNTTTTTVPSETNVGFTPNSSSATTEATGNVSSSTVSSLSSSSSTSIHNIGGMALSEDALYLWLILRRLFHDPSLQRNCTNTSSVGLSSIGKVLRNVPYSSLVEHRIQHFVYNVLMQYGDSPNPQDTKGCIPVIYSLINKLSDSNFQQLITTTTTQTIPIIPFTDFVNEPSHPASQSLPPSSSSIGSIDSSRNDSVYVATILRKLSTLLSTIYDSTVHDAFLSSVAPSITSTTVPETFATDATMDDVNDDRGLTEKEKEESIFYYPPSFFYSSITKPMNGTERQFTHGSNPIDSSGRVPLPRKKDTVSSCSSSVSIPRAETSTSPSPSSSFQSFRVASTFERIIRRIGTFYRTIQVPTIHIHPSDILSLDSDITDPLEWWTNLNCLLEIR